ncbi:tripartite tricarboxylate transporter substrate binding protein [Salipiger thiooxidans]|uniref:Bug family tripartite tricarboxylate transporter substrate binding protein n=1 Tax=Salipiger thiooxidans TaxID=282683 RepID=UPI001A8F772E|nr:tripartite tricarboxylate transporter substrate binding protein [Salipiger thiooxidans]MBN8190392.1 tripartite tricarboxylate transporter substrate binding protein [Salipiger thiooxidans]
MAALSLAAMAGIDATVGPAFAAGAKDWPTRPVKLIVPAKPGGGTDAVVRILATKLETVAGRPFAIVNQPTGGGSVAAETVRAARPDGNTLLFYHSGLLSSYHSGVYSHNPATEFTTIAMMPVGGSQALAVGPDVGIDSVEDLVTKAKAAPDSVTMGVQLKGASHFMAGLLMRDSGAPFRLVEAGSDADKFTALQGGNIDAAIVNTSGALQYAEAGKLKILGTVTGRPERDPGAPDYPSMVELGFKNTMYGFDFMVLGPKGLDPGLTDRINAVFGEVINDPAIQEQLAKMNLPISFMDRDASVERIVASEKTIGEVAAEIGLKN